MIAVSLGRPQRHAVVASAAYFEKHRRPIFPADLLDHQCMRVRLPNGAMFKWHFEKLGEAVQIDVPGRITLDEPSVARMTVLGGVGIGLFMEQDVIADIQAGRLVRVLEDCTPDFEGLCLYYPNRRNSSAALKAFMKLTRKIAPSVQD